MWDENLFNIYFMKTLFILILFIAGSKCFGQETKYGTLKKIGDKEYLRNTKVTIGNIVFDYRVLKYYSEDDLKGLTEIKRKQINLIYTQSYSIMDIDKCKSFRETDVDIGYLEIYRKEDKENIVAYGKDCQMNVKLISRNSLQKKMKELEP